MDATGWLLMVWAIILVGVVLGLMLSSRVSEDRGDDWLDPFSMTGQARDGQRWEAHEKTRELRDGLEGAWANLDEGGYIAGEMSDEETERLVRRFYGEK